MFCLYLSHYAVTYAVYDIPPTSNYFARVKTDLYYLRVSVLYEFLSFQQKTARPYT